MRLTVLESPQSSTAAAARAGLHDRLGRRVGYLRLSLTKACAMRCLYCRPEHLANPRDEHRMSPEEIHFLVAHLSRRHDLTKVRLTGGDPTSRPELVEILRRVSSVGGIRDLAMTTHGLTLEQHADEYREAGLQRLNVSLDTLDRDRFAQLTGVDGLSRVRRGIDAALDAGLRPLKLNTVVIRNHNDQDLPALLSFAADRDVEIRFIELMPMGPLAARWHERYVPEARMRRILAPGVALWTALPQGSDAARRYRVRLIDGRTAVIGFITPMSCNFCAACNRIRVAADGSVYPCLMDRSSGSLLPALRPRPDAEQLDAILSQCMQPKAAEHPVTGTAVMTHLGG